MTKQIKIVVEKGPEGYTANPLCIKDVIVGEGNSYEEALDDVKSAIRFHIESSGKEAIDFDPPVLEA